MRSWLLRGTVAALAAGAFAALFLPIHPVGSTVGTTYLSLDTPLSPEGIMQLATGNIPPDCSTWHELYPAFCATHHQDTYQDNGDGCVSPCDVITLSGVPWHVTWVGPTYYLTCFPESGPPTQVIWEPSEGPHDPASPVCEQWHEVWPNFCQVCHIDEWIDNDGSLNLTPCDDVFYAGTRYHVDDIRLNIIIEPPATGTKESTWGKVKRWFHDQQDHDQP